MGLFGRRTDAAVSRIIAGRDNRSVRFLVPDGRVVDRGYHAVTVVDMGEEREPMVVMKDMMRLGELWPAEVFDHMKWHQQDFELLRKSAKKTYSQTRPMPCRFCGKVIRVDMYRHVARLHLDLVQLWRCPIAWCTTWKGSPQDCLEHVRSGHDAPWVSKTASIEKYAPPWTVRRQVWTDSLRVDSSGISTDMLLFSEVGMPLTQHYRVYRGGLPHAVFRTDYLSRIRSLLPSPEGDDTPPQTGNVSTPKSVRRQHRAIAVPAIPPVGTADPFGRGEGFDMELAKVMCDVSVLPSLVSPIQEVKELSPTDASNYAAPAVPELDIIIDPPGYTVPEELGCSWIPEFAPVSEGVCTEEGSFLQSLQEPLPSETVESAVAPTVTDVIPPTVPVTPARSEASPVTNESPSATECVTPTDTGLDLSREMDLLTHVM